MDRLISLPLLAQQAGDYSIRIVSSGVPAFYRLSLASVDTATAENISRYQIETALLATFVESFDLGHRPPDEVLARVRDYSAWCASHGNSCSLQAGFLCAAINEHSGRYKEAEACATGAVAFLNLDPDLERRLAFLAEAAVLELPAGNLVRAQSLVQQARPLLSDQTNGFLKVLALNNFCAIRLSGGESAAAKPDCQAALDLAQQIGFETGMANAIMGLAQIDSYHGGTEVVDAAEKAATIFHRYRDYRGAAEALQKTLPVLWRQGKPQIALARATDALALCKEANDPHLCWESLYWMGIIYESNGDFPKARAYYQEALKAADSADDVLSGLSIQLRLIHADLIQSHDTQSVLQSYSEVLKRGQALHAENIEVEAMVRIGEISVKTGDLSTAERYFNQALAIYRKNSVTDNEQAILYSLGGVYRSQHNYDKALATYREALEISQKIGFRTGSALALSGIARTERQQGALDDALSSMEESIRVLESQRTDILSPEMRMRFLADLKPFFDEEFDLLVEMNERKPEGSYMKKAFRLSEQSKARVLLENIPTLQEGLRVELSPDILARAAQLKDKVVTASTDPKTDKSDLDRAIAEYDQTLAQIQARAPMYRALASPEILDPDDVSKWLNRDAVLIEFRICPHKSLAFVLSPTEPMFVAQLAGGPALQPLIDALVKAQSTTGTADADEQYQRAAGALSQALLAPLQGHMQHKRLFLVSDGALQNVSFAALPDPSTPAAYQPLVADHEIAYLPSASVASAIDTLMAHDHTKKQSILVFADPAFAGDTFPARPSSGFSVENDLILKAFAGQTIKDYVGLRASLDSLTVEDLLRYSILHFATHTDVDLNHPQLSGIRLSSVRSDGKPRDGTLHLLDIYNLHLASELVVLSSCESAAGPDMPGEGMIAVARGFIYAGSRRTLGTLWSPQMYDPPKLMQRFYTSLLKAPGFTPASALRMAQISLWNEGESPRVWANFVLLGGWAE